MNTTGRIDVHSHILPGIDDGCPNLEASLNCVRQMIEAGYSGTICTPHIIPKAYPRNTPQQVREWVREFQLELTRNGIEYQVWAGGECTLDPENWSMFERIGIPTLGNSRCVLLDWWGTSWPTFADETLDRLLREGYQPILAHPERMQLPVKELKTLAQNLSDRGVWLQGNLNSLSGGEGPQSQQLSHDWLLSGTYKILGSDTHHPDRLPGRLGGLQVAIELVGIDQINEMVANRTSALLDSWQG